MEQSLEVGGAGGGAPHWPHWGAHSVCPHPPSSPPQLLGATAIEDKLQDGVLETIKCLKQRHQSVGPYRGQARWVL